MALAVCAGIFGTGPVDRPRSAGRRPHTPRSGAESESVSNVLFGDAGVWAKADKPKSRLDPNQQAAAGVIVPKEADR